MLMRYEWGLGIGHTYSWKDTAPQFQESDAGSDPEEPDDISDTESGFHSDGGEEAALCLDDQENESLDDEESEGDCSVESEDPSENENEDGW